LYPPACETRDQEIVETHKACMHGNLSNPVGQGVIAAVKGLRSAGSGTSDDHDFTEAIMLHPVEVP
jgi:hypothetical protein